MKYSYENCLLTFKNCRRQHAFCVESIVIHKEIQTIDFFGSGKSATVTYSQDLTGFATFALWLEDVESKLNECCMAASGAAIFGNANIANQQIQTAVLEEIRDLERSELTGLGCYQLVADSAVRGELVAVYNEDKTFDRYDLHTGTGVQVVAIADVKKCVNEVSSELENNKDFTDSFIDYTLLIASSPTGANGIDKVTIVPKGDGVTVDIPPNTGAKIEAGRSYTLGEDDNKTVRNDFIINNPNGVEINIVWDSIH